jgi:integrase
LRGPTFALGFGLAMPRADDGQEYERQVKQMREQKGYIFRKGKSWFVRYCDDVLQSDGTIKRKLLCKKLSVPYCDEFRSKASVRQFAQEFLAPVNGGMLNPQSTMLVTEFVEKIYLPQYVEKQLRVSTQKSYRAIYQDHLKNHLGKLTLRGFRTVHGEQLLADIARQRESPLGKNSLRHIKSFLSGVFKQAKRLGILDGINPMQDTSIPHTPEPEDTYAYSLVEVTRILTVLAEPTKTIVLTAALTGLRKGEIRGLCWADFDGKELNVRRSVWNSTVNEPKTNRSKAPVPVVRQLVDALNAHSLRMGVLAQPNLPIFQAGNGKPLNLDNLARRVISPALTRCAVCRQPRTEHGKAEHAFQLDKTIPSWHGWHAFRRGLATNLHTLGVDDKTIQAILRHSNVGLTINVYIKSVTESQINAMDVLGARLEKETSNNLATDWRGIPN